MFVNSLFERLDTVTLYFSYHSVWESVPYPNRRMKEGSDRSHRVGPPKEDRKSPRPIIIKLTTYRARQLLIANRRKLKGSHIGIDEDLTHQNRSLLEEAKKNPKVLAAWSSDGNIIVLLNAGNNTQVKKRVRCAQDLPKY